MVSGQIIESTVISWFDPGVYPPPFDRKLLLMVAGWRSDACGGMFEPYTVVLTAYVQTSGPDDAYNGVSTLDEFEAGGREGFLDFQFNLKSDDGETLDWYSDSIIAWAYYPLNVEQTAFEVEKARQAAAVRA